ncbi:MAG: zinc ribbon domain-containing protein [Oscillospiraceae bacterium]|nr:zinc ribbon domain-containing protein [Oscillospiraceae bacterium]
MAKFCTNCGATLDDDKKFCTECGAPVNEAPAGAAAPPPRSAPQPQAAPVYAQAATATMPPPAYQPAAAYGADAPPPKGSKYEPITTGGYIGIMLLMCIPIVGQILMIIWAFAARKVNKRSLARASLIMLVVMLIISFLIGLAVKSLFGKVVDIIEEETGVNITEITGGEGRDGESGGLGGLLGIVSGLSGDNGPTNQNIQELEELDRLLEGLGGSASGESGLDGLIDGAIQANKDAEAANDGWPKTLREYPGGTATATASYRTEISGTTLDEMMGWIEELKKDGFEYQDFYDFGMSEEDMLGMNGWWAYDGNTYLSVSYSDGTVIVDHTKELPDLESYFN